MVLIRPEKNLDLGSPGEIKMGGALAGYQIRRAGSGVVREEKMFAEPVKNTITDAGLAAFCNLNAERSAALFAGTTGTYPGASGFVAIGSGNNSSTTSSTGYITLCRSAMMGAGSGPTDPETASSLQEPVGSAASTLDGALGRGTKYIKDPANGRLAQICRMGYRFNPVTSGMIPAGGDALTIREIGIYRSQGSALATALFARVVLPPQNEITLYAGDILIVAYDLTVEFPGASETPFEMQYKGSALAGVMRYNGMFPDTTEGFVTAQNGLCHSVDVNGGSVSNLPVNGAGGNLFTFGAIGFASSYTNQSTTASTQANPFSLTNPAGMRHSALLAYDPDRDFGPLGAAPDDIGDTALYNATDVPEEGVVWRQADSANRSPITPGSLSHKLNWLFNNKGVQEVAQQFNTPYRFLQLMGYGYKFGASTPLVKNSLEILTLSHTVRISRTPFA
jgi:hypothetical protein